MLVGEGHLEPDQHHDPGDVEPDQEDRHHRQRTIDGRVAHRLSHPVGNNVLPDLEENRRGRGPDRRALEPDAGEWRDQIEKKEREKSQHQWEEPRHQLILSKSGIKVIDVRIPPKDTTEYHLHNRATLYNLISDVNVASQEYGKEWIFKTEKHYRKSGTFINLSKEYIQKNSYHRVANIDTTTFHLIGIVNTENYTNTEKESFDDWFIKHQIEVDKMKRSELKEFDNPVLIIQNSIGESSIIQENVIHSFKSEAGAVTWIPTKTQFKLINNSNATINYNIIELKDLINNRTNE